MSGEWRSFAFYDKRTGRRVGMASAGSLSYAERELAYFWERDAKGQRPDLHELLPHLAIVELTAATWGSNPGDLIAEATS